MPSPNAIPRVSVVIPCYNHGRYLPGALASVVAQTLASWEAVIVDDGSADDSAAVARALIGRYPGRAIRLIEQPNAGLSAARNSGIAAARAEYVLTLDADDLIEPAMLEQAVAAIDQRPDVGFVYTDVRMFGAEERVWSGGGYSLGKLLFDCPIVPIVLFRKAAWAGVGGFGRNLWPQGYEDWDFWLALAQAGWQGLHLAQPLARYRRSNSSMLANARRHDLELRAQLILNHQPLYQPGFVRWARAARAPGVTPDGAFGSRGRWWRAFVGYLALVARHRPDLLPKTLARPLFVRLPAARQGYARSLARLLRVSR